MKRYRRQMDVVDICKLDRTFWVVFLEVLNLIEAFKTNFGSLTMINGQKERIQSSHDCGNKHREDYQARYQSQNHQVHVQINNQ